MTEIPKGSLIVATSIEVRDQSKLAEFMQHVRGSLDQARVAEGLLHVDTLAEPPRYYTRSIWRPEADMVNNFRNTGAHAQAMRRGRILSPEIITTRWNGNSIPTWDEVKERLMEEWGRLHGGF